MAIVTILIAWGVGILRSRENAPDCKTVLPGAQICRTITSDTFEGVIANSNQTETVVGWAKVAAASGYSGKVTVLIGVTPDGKISGISIIDQTETPAYFKRVIDLGYVNQFVGLPADSPLHWVKTRCRYQCNLFKPGNCRSRAGCQPFHRI